MIPVDKLIAKEIAEANGLNLTALGLRFDKVVVRLFWNIRTAITQEVPKEKTVVITVTAPIKYPAKTGEELIIKIKHILKSDNKASETLLTIFQNKIQVKIVALSSKKTVEVVGLVHNLEIEPEYLIKLTCKWLMRV
jgi:uracil phosphoribosyltransferase